MVGLDFDNTIVCYDGLFHAAAVEQGLVGAEAPVDKEQIRDRLRRLGREDDWTRLQGYVYGPGMALARPFPGALEFLARCRAADVAVAVISHRTLSPYLGPRYDLHASARSWLETAGVVDQGRTGLTTDAVHLETTREAKLARIARCECSHFVDDLPEFLCDPDFPAGVKRVLFDPHRREPVLPPAIRRASSWEEVSELVLAATPR